MSSIVGAFGNLTEEIKARFPHFDQNPLMKENSRNLIFFAFGNSNTLCHSHLPTGEKIIISGCGINHNGGKPQIMTAADWAILTDLNELSQLDGHFVHLLINESEITISTDVLGLRDIFIFLKGDVLYFSTRLDWLSKLIGSKIDLAKFGSRVFLQNQISDDTFLVGAARLTQGKFATYNLVSQKITYGKRRATTKQLSADSLEGRFTQYLAMNTPAGLPRQLCLSGGFDSRVVLSLMLKNDKNIETVTFGQKQSPDSIVPTDLSRFYGLKHTLLDEPLPVLEDFLQEFEEYTNQTLMNNSARSFAHLRNYHFLPRNAIIFDGGFGEIWRRGFMQKLYYFGKKAVTSGDSAGAMKFISDRKCDFFSPEAEQILYMGAVTELDSYFAERPFTGGDFGNYLDRFTMNTRLINCFSQEQTYLDTMLLSIMPFTQNSLISSVETLATMEKINSKIFKKIVKDNHPEMQKFPLAKKDYFYSYNSGIFRKALDKITKKHSKLPELEAREKKIITYLRPYLLDILSKNDIAQNGIFDAKKINHLRAALHSNDITSEDINNLDWFLSFYLLYKNY